MIEDFTWRDGERIVLFRHGGFGASPELLAEQGWGQFDLLTTERALASAPEGLKAVSAVHEVPGGPVDAASAAIISEVRADRIVALGGGRVIDVAKAIGAVKGGFVGAIPTTLAGSPITSAHRLPAGHEEHARGLVRPNLVIADPVLMTSAPEGQLRATAMNALAHAAESLYTPFANPVSEMAALRGAELIAHSLDAGPDSRDAGELALGAILGAQAIGSTGFALHHALCQTVVRVLGLPHAEINATLLPVTMTEMNGRAPGQIAKLAAALGTSPEQIGDRIAELGGGRRRLSELGAERDRIEEVLDALDQRPDIAAMTPGAPDRGDLARLLENAW